MFSNVFSYFFPKTSHQAYINYEHDDDNQSKFTYLFDLPIQTNQMIWKNLEKNGSIKPFANHRGTVHCYLSRDLKNHQDFQLFLNRLKPCCSDCPTISHQFAEDQSLKSFINYLEINGYQRLQQVDSQEFLQEFMIILTNQYKNCWEVCLVSIKVTDHRVISHLLTIQFESKLSLEQLQNAMREHSF